MHPASFMAMRIDKNVIQEKKLVNIKLYLLNRSV
jgi:hypothetical protein